MNKKIYFAGSIRGGRNDREVYLKIIEHLSNYGDVLTEHIGDVNLLKTGEEMDDSSIFKRDLNWLMACDILVAEVSTPSLGVGYELGIAEASGKRVLCLYRESSANRLSAMIKGNAYFHVVNYEQPTDAFAAIETFFNTQ